MAQSLEFWKRLCCGIRGWVPLVLTLGSYFGWMDHSELQER